MFEEIDKKYRHGFCGWLIVHESHWVTALNSEIYKCQGWAKSV